ncbi:MAG: glycosyltransferase, partial [Candidatus Aminicenantes bacterium]|nr:glycosyltransferase [Candidatus Aminicenantes bacterium]
MDTILIVIPLYNEGKNISGVISDIHKNFNNADIIAVNDRSSDNTAEKLEELGVAHLDLPFNMGYAGAVQAGFKYAAGKNYDYVV